MMAICPILVQQRIPSENRVNSYSFAYLNRVALETEPKTIGAAVRKCRVQKGLTQSELGRLLGVSSWTVNAWEAGHSRPAKFRHLVAKWMGVSVETLLNLNPRVQ